MRINDFLYKCFTLKHHHMTNIQINHILYIKGFRICHKKFAYKFTIYHTYIHSDIPMALSKHIIVEINIGFKLFLSFINLIVSSANWLQ